jgi:VanZ family protein
MVIWLRYWGPLCAYAGLIFYLSAQPHPEEDLPSFVLSFSDKALHVVEYAVLGGLCYRAFRWGANESWGSAAFPLAVLVASLYGISDEVHQSFVPFRDSSWLDWLADVIGSAMGAAGLARISSLTSDGGSGARFSQRKTDTR